MSDPAFDISNIRARESLPSFGATDLLRSMSRQAPSACMVDVDGILPRSPNTFGFRLACQARVSARSQDVRNRQFRGKTHASECVQLSKRSCDRLELVSAQSA